LPCLLIEGGDKQMPFGRSRPRKPLDYGRQVQAATGIQRCGVDTVRRVRTVGVWCHGLGSSDPILFQLLPRQDRRWTSNSHSRIRPRYHLRMATNRRAIFPYLAAMAAATVAPFTLKAADDNKPVKVAGGWRIGNLYYSSGLTGVRPEARKDPLAFGGDVKEQTRTTLNQHKKNLESLGSSLANVIKVTVFLADVKTEKNAMNEVYAEFFKSNAPARSAFGVEFPDTATRVEIELVAWIP